MKRKAIKILKKRLKIIDKNLNFQENEKIYSISNTLRIQREIKELNKEYVEIELKLNQLRK